MRKNYFLNTPPKDYEFLGYYSHRRQQPDFTFSFEKESYILTMELEKLIKGNYSSEIKVSASQLYNKLKASLNDHRIKYRGVQLFWDMIESSFNDINPQFAHLGNIQNAQIGNNLNYNTKWHAEGPEVSKNCTPIFCFPPKHNEKPATNPLNVPINEKPNLDFSGGSFSSESGNTHDTELIKFVHEGLKTLGMKAIITRKTYRNPVTKKIDFFDNGGVDIIAWYREMEVFIQCKGSTNPVTIKTIQEMENLLLKQVGKVGCIVSESNINQNIINMVNSSKRKIILTTKSKAYFDIESYYNAIKMPRQVPLVHNNEIVVEDMRIEVVKGDDDEVNMINYGQIGVKGKGNTKLNVSCKKICQKLIDPTTQFTIGQFSIPNNLLKK
ncbi:unnamed protein product [Rhizophagus irregularis]|nr:unnamed protein product [Rhizophagus irregularis]CAB5383842.1 unnamed protein product [Rhizophagus irregularis]